MYPKALFSLLGPQRQPAVWYVMHPSISRLPCPRRPKYSWNRALQGLEFQFRIGFRQDLCSLGSCISPLPLDSTRSMQGLPQMWDTGCNIDQFLDPESNPKLYTLRARRRKRSPKAKAPHSDEVPCIARGYPVVTPPTAVTAVPAGTPTALGGSGTTGQWDLRSFEL